MSGGKLPAAFDQEELDQYKEGEEVQEEVEFPEDPKFEDESEKSEEKKTGDTDSKDDGEEQDKKEDGDKEEVIDRPTFYRAVRLGMSEDAINSFSDTEKLAQHLDRLEIASGDSKKSEEKDTGKKESETKSDESDDELLKTKLDLEKGYEEDLVNEFKAIRKEIVELRKENTALKQQSTSFVEQTNVEKAKNFEREFDGMINDLGDEFVDIFGKGSGTELDQKSSSMSNRLAVLGEMVKMMNNYQAAQKPVPQTKELFDFAVHQLFKKEVKSAAKKEVLDNIRNEATKREKHMVNKPTHRDRDKTGIKKAYDRSFELDQILAKAV